MSNRAVVRLAVVLAIAQGTTLRAQAPSSETSSLLRRVQVLDSAMLARGRAVDSIRRALVRSVPPVVVRAGALHVRTDSTLEPQVRLAVQSVARLIDQRGGKRFVERASSYVPTITPDSTRSIFGMVPIIAIDADTARRWSMIGQRQVQGKASAAQLADALGMIVEQFAMQGVDSAFAAWIMLGRAPLRPASTLEGADAYIELATTESIALRRCRARDVSSCLDVLGIDSMPGSRLERWYAPEDYRAVVRTVAPSRNDSTAVAAWIRCRRQHDEAGCQTAARALGDGQVPLPLSASVRFTFLREVLDAGGAESFDRLVTAPGTVRERLARAANEPLDRTVLRWLDRVERARPERMHVPAGLVVASLGWTGIILGLALIRRTSWA